MAIPNLLKDGRDTGRAREASQKEQDGDHLRLNQRQLSEVTSPRHLTLYYVGAKMPKDRTHCGCGGRLDSTDQNLPLREKSSEIFQSSLKTMQQDNPLNNPLV